MELQCNPILLSSPLSYHLHINGAVHRPLRSTPSLYGMQTDTKEPAAAAPAVGKPPSICDRLQRAFHARPAFRPLRRLTVLHHDGGAAKPAALGAGPDATHGGPPVPAPPQPPSSVAGAHAPAPTAPPAPQPVPVCAPAVAEMAAVNSAPPGAPAPAGDTKAEDKAKQTKGKIRVGSRVRKALSSK
ncbi:lysine-rich arabinogalactan protein 19-like [Phragmites australis]|uniref:lysine-rich arabinogalactan protein 19-like n=1 Tax=Phragmites australis TaxID=29695 RepID=UPI002D775C22|nr:lysine-rich arabinogalactan protein 19-like [Phragmites australis]